MGWTPRSRHCPRHCAKRDSVPAFTAGSDARMKANASMPEGDTIFRAAQTLNKALAGKTVITFRSGVPHIGSRERESLEGTVVEHVGSHGKHLLVHFSSGKVLHTHMRMNGT